MSKNDNYESSTQAALSDIGEPIASFNLGDARYTALYVHAEEIAILRLNSMVVQRLTPQGAIRFLAVGLTTIEVSIRDIAGPDNAPPAERKDAAPIIDLSEHTFVATYSAAGLMRTITKDASDRCYISAPGPKGNELIYATTYIGVIQHLCGILRIRFEHLSRLAALAEGNGNRRTLWERLKGMFLGTDPTTR